MPLVVPDVAEQRALELLLNKATPENLVIKLYVNDKVPAETDTAASYTEASGFGYAAKTLTGVDWTITPGAPTVAVAPQQTWTFTGALGNVYGYYMVGAVSGLLYWAERFAGAPFLIQNNGDQIKITPRITAD